MLAPLFHAGQPCDCAATALRCRSPVFQAGNAYHCAATAFPSFLTMGCETCTYVVTCRPDKAPVDACTPPARRRRATGR
jgi:hypothetical protein